MANIILHTNSSKSSEGKITVTAHLEPEGDGTHEKVIAQTRVDGFILPPGTSMEITSAPFTAAQEARIREIVASMLPDE